MAASGKFRFCIDRGGTFTDVYAQCPGGKVRVLKLLSEDPSSYPDAPREAIRRILEQELGAPMPANEPLSCSAIQWIRMGTTVATNALLERKGERTALAITRGFRDLLYIGNQSRPDLFDLTVSMPETLYERVVEVKERVVLCQGDCQLGLSHPVVVGSTGEELYEVEPVDVASLRQDLAAVLALGIRSLAVVLLHSYTFPAHEQVVGEVAREMGFTHVSLSSQVMPMVRAVPRGFTVCADAYLTPCIKKYVAGFTSGFKDKEHLKVLFMQSDGGLTPMNRFVGSRAILSGPAGGVVGYAVTAYHHQLCGGCQRLPVIGFDMGGTSTDVSRYTGEYEHIFESTVAGVVIQSPQLDISTVAAGGGSMLCFRAGLFVVGPESAGANPGPACYSKGGPLTVTDANLCLGRLLPSYFPKIFGPNEDQPLNEPAMLLGFQRLTDKVNEALGGEGLSVQEVALGYVRVAVESMCKPIRAITQGKGHDTSSHVLACFGGAGGQHACAVAKALGISTVYIHRYSGILSAYGLALADVVHEAQEPCAVHYEDSTFQYLDERLDVLSRECVDELEKQGFKRDEITTQPYLHLRYDKTDCPIMCAPLKATENSCRHGDFKASFTQHYHCEFGFTIPNRAIVVDDVRVRGLGRGLSFQPHPLQEANAPPVVDTVTQCYFEGGYVETSVYLQEQLCYGHRMEGPCILIDTNSTILVEPGCVASISKHGDVLIEVGSESIPCVGTGLDAIHLSIFSHRFMSIAEQMGRVLQRTSISTNIKERLDFSCALFGPTGGLVANAPHIPVHLGAMQEAVKFQIQYLGGDVREGDVILSNHPSAGGSHLPDLTVITPVFYPEQEKPVFFVANRGHHAEIGGISPGSMPPFSKYLWQEGMCVKSFKLVQNGVFQEEGLVRLLESPGTQPGSSGSRNIRDNISDLRAQVAANQKGIHLVRELIDVYSLPVVQAYMAYIQENAEGAVRDMLKEVSQSMQGPSLSALEHLDDGTAIQLSISITSQGEATFDFSGTGRLVAGNLNAPRAVTLSAILYCLRCMVAHDVPLNQGCLKPVKVVIPEGSVLDPREDSAVVGGNVLTCQRLVDVVFKAFAVCAASQGCMNNTVFGDESMGYYETVAGGAGAGPGWHGRSGVHTHMTNTRITDPEILERRYPVVLKQFHLNRGTGGLGLYCGGDGVLREMLFRRPLTLSVLTERRGPYKPYGLEGGGDGSTGRNTLVRASGQEQDLSGKACVGVEPGDTFRLESPAGGGYGDPSAVLPAVSKPPNTAAPLKGGGSLYTYKLNQESA